MRRHLALAALVGGVAVALEGCNDAPNNDEAEPVSQPTSSDNSEDAHQLPRSAYMKRLAADDGGVWKGTVEGGRIILYLGAPQPDTVEDSYVAVLWDAREPKVRIFEFMRFLVDQAGNISITLFPVEGHKPRSEPVLVFGKYVNGSIRLEEIHESSNSFPAVATLERSAIDNEVDELRKRFKRGLDKDY